MPKDQKNLKKKRRKGFSVARTVNLSKCSPSEVCGSFFLKNKVWSLRHLLLQPHEGLTDVEIQYICLSGFAKRFLFVCLTALRKYPEVALEIF